MTPLDFASKRDSVSHYCEAVNGRLPYAEQDCAYCRRYLEGYDGDT
ncbi:hypothetical protein [Halobellus sp. Atlit-38R]|jgi:hypothetical protein|nr:hypothetical protein [Halobellus sp. Atlit-38R]